MPTKDTQSRSIYLILVVALVIRIAAALVWQAQLGDEARFKLGDSDGYWQLGLKIANGEPYQYNSEHAKVFRTPGYPMLLGGFFSLWSDPPVVAVRILGALLGTLSLWLLWHLARLLFDTRTAWFATWIACFYPGAIAISILVLAEALFVPLMLAQFLSTAVAFKSREWRPFLFYSFAAGLFFGVACLTRPSWLLFVPFGLLFGFVCFPQRKRQLVSGAVCLMMLVLVMLPWWIRNYQVTGKFVLTSLQTGTSLYDGWNPDATGASDMEFAPRMKAEYLAEYRKNELGPEREFEYAFNERMKKRATEWAQQNPGRVVELAWIKLKRIWNPIPNSTEIGSTSIRYAIAAYFLPLFVLAIWGTCRYRKDYIAIYICLVPAVYYTCLHMVFVGSIRYRQPPMMTFLILAAALLAHWSASKKTA